MSWMTCAAAAPGTTREKLVELGRVCIRGTLGDAALNAVDFETARICGDMRGYWVLWVQVPEGQDEVAKIWRRDGGTACETTPPEVEA